MSTATSQEIYLGHLLSYSDFKILGLSTNTDMKLLVACDINTQDSAAMKDIIMQMYNHYIHVVMNPFHVLDTMLVSSKFHNEVSKLLAAVNNPK